MMLKFGLEIALEKIQKSDVAIFEILTFCDLSADRSPKFCDFGPLKDQKYFKNVGKGRVVCNLK